VKKISKALVVGFLLGFALFVIFYPTKVQAKEKNNQVTERYFLVQKHLAGKPLGTSEPRRLYCLGKKCTLFLGSLEQDNFFSSKLCKKTYEEGRIAEYACSNKNTTQRVIETSRENHNVSLLEYLLPKREEPSKYST
jgi:hypothetical protein